MSELATSGPNNTTWVAHHREAAMPVAAEPVDLCGIVLVWDSCLGSGQPPTGTVCGRPPTEIPNQGTLSLIQQQSAAILLLPTMAHGLIYSE